jgi:hypothetical protein
MLKKSNRIIHLFIALVVAAAVCATYLGTPATSSASTKKKENPKAAKALKISPQLRGGKHATGEQVRAIVELSAPVSGQLNAFLNRNGVHLRK